MIHPHREADTRSSRNREIQLSVPLRERFLPVVTGFVETSARALGSTKPEALKLTLSSEELFLHLCRILFQEPENAEIDCRGHGSYVQVDFSFPLKAFSMSALNMTAGFHPDDPAELDDVRLILASRSVDRLIIVQQDNRLRLSLIKEKNYPALPPCPPSDAVVETEFSLYPPDAEEIKFFCTRVQHDYSRDALPRFCYRPGMLADMLADAEYGAQIAKTPSGHILGGMVWHRISRKTVEAFGPYSVVSDRENRVAIALIEECISQAARSPATGIICLPPVSARVSRHFENLGSLPSCTQSGNRMRQHVWFRLLHEDTGCVTWTTGQLADFLQATYNRLVLPREIRVIPDTGEPKMSDSVISADIDRIHSQVTLKLIWPGDDAGENLARHLTLLNSEKIRSILFQVDLGVSWEAGIIPDLITAGFAPRLLLPNAGTGDEVIFDLGAEES